MPATALSISLSVRHDGGDQSSQFVFNLHVSLVATGNSQGFLFICRTVPYAIGG
jgi:hypothetical protein